jgi:muconolactone delta-isomerase
MEAGKIVALYKVSSQRRVIGVFNVESTDELDEIIMAGLPMAEYLTFEQVLPVREYTSFAEDIRRRWEQAGKPKLVPQSTFAPSAYGLLYLWALLTAV